MSNAPCPFCGYTGVTIYFHNRHHITGDGIWRLECCMCQASGPIRLGRADWGDRIRPMLIEAWEKRAAPVKP